MNESKWLNYLEMINKLLSSIFSNQLQAYARR